jgi:hypothetical protein
MPNWLDVVLDRIGSEDEDKLNYPAHYDGKSGYLVLSQRRLLFVEERGFIHKTDTVILDVPYEKITRITVEDGTLVFTEVDGVRHYITSIVPISTIENALRELRESVFPTATKITT